MAEIEIGSLLEALAADAGRCAPASAAELRRFGDRRRVAVRTATAGAAVAIIGTTAGTAFAVSQTGTDGGASTITAGHSASPRPVAPHRHRRDLRRKLQLAQSRLAEKGNRLAALEARHRAGGIDGHKYRARRHELQREIAMERSTIRRLRAELRRHAKPAPVRQSLATPTASPTSSSVGSSAPTSSPTPTGRGVNTPTPSPTPTG